MNDLSVGRMPKEEKNVYKLMLCITTVLPIAPFGLMYKINRHLSLIIHQPVRHFWQVSEILAAYFIFNIYKTRIYILIESRIL